MSRRIHRHGSHALWRAVLWSLLIGVVVVAPVARAVCDLEHVALASVDRAAGHGGAPAPDPHSDDDPCCTGDLAVMTVVPGLASDATAAPGAAPFHFHVLPAFAAPRPELRGVRVGRATPLPPEPVFRRVPKLLF